MVIEYAYHYGFSLAPARNLTEAKIKESLLNADEVESMHATLKTGN